MNYYEEQIINLCEPGTSLGSIPYKNAITKVEVICANGHSRLVSPNLLKSRGSGKACKTCQGKDSNGKLLLSTVISLLETKGFELVGRYLGALKPILVRNKACGHEYLAKSYADISRGRSPKCPVCDNSIRRNIGQIIKDVQATNNITIPEHVSTVKQKINIKFNSCGHYQDTSLENIERAKNFKCARCADSIHNRFLSKLIGNQHTLVEEYKTSQEAIHIKYENCQHVAPVIPLNYVHANSGTNCSVCYPTGISRGEVSVREYLEQNYKGWIEYNCRNVISPLEIDIMLPELGIGIEYNGMYWHSTDKKPLGYHVNKSEAMEALDFKLIQINEDEWVNKPDIVKSRLNNLLGISSRKFARNTTCKQISFPEEFLNRNHIQGAGAPTPINYGLYEGSELLAVMTFAKPRFNKEYDYELVRFASKLNTTVIGGASKLLKYFRDHYRGSIISYSDRRWSTGGLYKTLGFKHLHNSTPNYRYYKGLYSLSRYQCQKHLLKTKFPEFYSDELTEKEIMSLAGYIKVEDAGNGVWGLA